MTKRIRIEDADQSNWQVVVKVMQRGSRQVIEGPSGSGVVFGPDTQISESRLGGPTDQREFYIHDGQYLVIAEDGSRKPNFDAAISFLAIAAEICEHNAPINDKEGNTVQADANRASAASYREAIRSLQS